MVNDSIIVLMTIIQMVTQNCKLKIYYTRFARKGYATILSVYRMTKKNIQQRK